MNVPPMNANISILHIDISGFVLFATKCDYFHVPFLFDYLLN